MTMSGIGAGDQQNSAGVSIQPVNDAGAGLASGGRKCLEVVQQCVHEGSGMAAGPGVYDHTSGFIDCDQIIIYVKDVERNVFRKGFERWEFARFNFYALPPSQSERRFLH